MENVDLSEYDFKEYQGHINVKTHYNAFKQDVIFTYYKDIPIRDDSNKIIKWEQTIQGKVGYAGIAGNKGFSEESLIGKTFEGEYIDATSLEREKYQIPLFDGCAVPAAADDALVLLCAVQVAHSDAPFLAGALGGCADSPP